jgi:tRNA (guanine-N7-)-methyltransferase
VPCADRRSDRQQSRPERAFFGRRKGRRLSPARAALLETLLPRIALDLSNQLKSLSSVFPDRVEEVRLEIGFGAGEHLLAQASTNRQIGFIGIEPFSSGMAKALAGIAAQSLTNIRLHYGDATQVLPWLPAASLARVDVLYPDPWPKRRHWKRRFVQHWSVSQIARALCGGGELRIATDVASYAEWTLRHLLQTPAFEWTAEGADDWRIPWSGFAATRYEQKARREGRQPCYLIFRRL